MKYIALALLLASGPAWSQVEIDAPWIRATPPGAKIAAGYMTIQNNAAQPDRLVGGSSPMAEKVQTHLSFQDGDIMRMRQVKGYDIPANGSFELKPSGAHLMLVDIKQPLKEGDKVPVTLRFEHAGEVRVDFRVVPLGGPAMHHVH